ncbi:MAG: hypothetical protein IPF99_28855 [Deltaproteobacteria bacterium]|nr:hypothetical protein [Deltaproteobacteria bacterium]
MNRSHLPGLVLGLLGACGEPRSVEPTFAPSSQIVVAPAAPVAPVAATVPSTQPAPAHDGMRSPLDVSWVTVASDDHHAVLLAHVERAPRLDVPLQLTVTVPAGVTIARGAPSFALPPASQQATADYEYELTYPRVPSEDVLLAVDGDSETMGVHGRAWFRFGRPEPLGPRPVANGPVLNIGGRNFGPAVSAQQPGQ